MKNFKVIVIDGIISAGKSTLISLIENDEKIKEKYDIVIIKEPVDKWVESGILRKFYDDMSRWGYHFQTKVFHDKIMESINQYNRYISNKEKISGVCCVCNNSQEISQSIPKCNGCGLKNSISINNLDSLEIEPKNKETLFILERSCLTDKLFMELLYEDHFITDMEYDHYKEWCDLWELLLPFKFDLFIYLRPSLDACMRRVEERHRDGEGGVSKEYQQKLMDKHDLFFKEGGIELYGKIIPVKILETDDNFKNDKKIQDKIIAQFIEYINAIKN